MFASWNDPTISAWRQDYHDLTDISRNLGPNEAGFYYYANSDKKAPSDTFIRLSCRLPESMKFVEEDHIIHAWALLRCRHPLLDCHIRQDPLKFHWICTDNWQRAQRSVTIAAGLRDWEIERDELTNCPRIINDETLSHLRVYHDHSSRHITFVILCSHAISDAMSLTLCAKDFLNFLAHDRPLRTLQGDIDTVVKRLPPALEGSLPQRQRDYKSLWKAAIMYTVHASRQDRKPKDVPSLSWRDRHPITRQAILDLSSETTGRLIRLCKTHDCTLGHLIYAASNIAFTALIQPTGHLTCIGTPANARRCFREPYRSRKDDFMVNLAFLDVYLPCVSLQSQSTENIRKLWVMARMAKRQVLAQLADPDFATYAYINQERRVTASWKKAHDAKLSIPTNEPGSGFLSYGSSAIGSLDEVLKLDSDRIMLEDISIGMRVRAGEALMHSYSFNGQLRLSCMYDDQLGAEVITEWLASTMNWMESTLTSSCI